MRYFRVRRSDGARVALIVGLLAGALAAGRSPSADAADPPRPPVTVLLAGSHMMSPLVAAWTGELITKDSPTRIGYTQGNALTGRKGLLAGHADAALSATPLQIDDLALIEELKADGQNPDFVTVPLNASALLFAELRPLAALMPLDVAGSPAIDVPPGPPGGYSMADAIQFYMKPPNLKDSRYATLHGYSVYNPLCPTPCPEEWEPPPPKLGDVSAPSGSIEIPARTGPSAMGWMLERIMKERAPDLWARYLAGINRPTDAVSEQIAIPFTFNGSEANRWASKFYPTMMDAMLEFASRGVSPCCFFAGLPPWVIQQYRYRVLDLLKLDRTVQAHLDRWELRPLVIDGVAPTPESIAQALVDGDGLSSTEAKIPNLHGGYPASFVNKMIVRTDTLKPERVNAMVDLITYMVTDGQVHAVKLGDPALPRFHVQRALEGANQIVTKACPTNRIIEGASIALPGTGTGPATVKLSRCGPVPAPTSATTATTTTSTLPDNTTSTAASSETTTTSSGARTNFSANDSSSNVVIANSGARTPSITAPLVTAAATESPVVATAAETADSSSGGEPAALTDAELAAYYDLTDVPAPTRKRSPALQPLLGAAAFAVGASRGRKRGVALGSTPVSTSS